jgi:hypothetical protein
MPFVPLADASLAKRVSGHILRALGEGGCHRTPFVTDVSLRMAAGELATWCTGN